MHDRGRVGEEKGTKFAMSLCVNCTFISYHNSDVLVSSIPGEKVLRRTFIGTVDGSHGRCIYFYNFETLGRGCWECFYM